MLRRALATAFKTAPIPSQSGGQITHNEIGLGFVVGEFTTSVKQHIAAHFFCAHAVAQIHFDIGIEQGL